MKSVLVGISGGIDSSMSVLILKDKGFHVTGVNFNFYGAVQHEQYEKLNELRKKLDIEIIEFDARELFHKEVISYFTSTHLMGKTPGPCSHCNPAVKWKLLYELAVEYKIDFIATGHYVRIIPEKNKLRIFQGFDIKKDQSYYLWRLEQNILEKAITPLGDYQKTEIIKLAFEKEFRFLTGKKESNGLCFSQGRSCDQLLKDYIPDLEAKIKSGNVVDKEGKIIGKHKGYIYYTIGQKKGLELDIPDKLCVASIDAVNNVIIADTWQSLYKDEFIIEDYVFPEIEELDECQNIHSIIRGFGLNPQGRTKFSHLTNNQIKVKLDTPAWAPAPGQPAVFYSDNKLLGGGIISKIESNL